MAGALQPLSMMSTMLEKRLQKPDPDFAALARNSSQLTALARDASSACMGLMTWLAPKTLDMVTIVAGIEDAAGLVMTELSFKGFTVVNEVGEVPAELPLSLMRNVFMAALLALTDAAAAPANVVLSAQLLSGELLLGISIQPVEGEMLPGGTPAYRNLDWEDVQALAEVESVGLKHSSDSVELRCPVTLTAA